MIISRRDFIYVFIIIIILIIVLYFSVTQGWLSFDLMSISDIGEIEYQAPPSTVPPCNSC